MCHWHRWCLDLVIWDCQLVIVKLNAYSLQPLNTTAVTVVDLTITKSAFCIFAVFCIVVFRTASYMCLCHQRGELWPVKSTLAVLQCTAKDSVTTTHNNHIDSQQQQWPQLHIVRAVKLDIVDDTKQFTSTGSINNIATLQLQSPKSGSWRHYKGLCPYLIMSSTAVRC